MGFTAKIGPKNGPILTKIGIHIDQTSDYYHAKFYQNRTTLSDMRAFSVTSDVQKPITTTDLSVALESVRLESSIQDEDQNQCLEVLDLAIEDVKKNQGHLEKERVEKEVEMLQLMKKDLIEMEDVSAGKKALKRMYEYFIEIANKTIDDTTLATEATVTAINCRGVLRSRLDNLIQLMELEKKCPALQDLGSQMDGLSVSDTVGESNDTAGASGILGAIKKIFEK